MKHILIQDKSAWGLDSLKDLLQMDFEGQFEIETTTCLAETELDITQYTLIVSHPHIFPPQNYCCLSHIKKAHDVGIPIVFTYTKGISETGGLEVMSDDFKIKLAPRPPQYTPYEFYSSLIRNVEIKS